MNAPAKTVKVVHFNPEVAERVCHRIATGMSIRAACAGDGFPAWRTFLRWLATDDVDNGVESGTPSVKPYSALRQQYARAREARADARFESLDNVLRDLKDGKLDAAAARVMLDAIKWQTGKENAKKYGEAVTVKGDRDNPLQVRTVRELSDDELQALALGGLRAAL